MKEILQKKKLLWKHLRDLRKFRRLGRCRKWALARVDVGAVQGGKKEEGDHKGHSEEYPPALVRDIASMISIKIQHVLDLLKNKYTIIS